MFQSPFFTVLGYRGLVLLSRDQLSLPSKETEIASENRHALARFPAGQNLRRWYNPVHLKLSSASEEVSAMSPSPQQISQLLVACSNGDQAALDQLMPLVYGELRKMARRYMRGQPAGHTLQTTALIHEAYLKLVGQQKKPWRNRAHFFGVAAQAMRHILVDYARSRQAAKRGGEALRVSLDETALVTQDRAAELVALDDALNDLAEVAPRQSRVVELRYFGGLSVEETAEVLKVSPETILRDWRMAKAWLLRQLQRGTA
jgi:RNA polymerase sigma factor (TIGR02999 family)